MNRVQNVIFFIKILLCAFHLYRISYLFYTHRKVEIFICYYYIFLLDFIRFFIYFYFSSGNIITFFYSSELTLSKFDFFLYFITLYDVEAHQQHLDIIFDFLF